MTYKIEIEIADVVGPKLDDLTKEIERAVDTIIYALLHHREAIDIDQLLVEHQAIAQVWDTSHVRDQRPDLTDEQAWEVLQECDRFWDRLNDPMRATIRRVTEYFYPVPE
ncbi:hypothetical protein [Fimbriiglobus ruber]|uniref:Uncharacterized protein n=1 Tax=Fimbriiglobus ruber TaxID=1908690 RepID=A0A225EDE5_9BACT|nr:hypothetical protein [Fimbriiglobus ruber]OWK46455.1 hypothetical protein FRUB_00154 [Fimbriiglobus ruber]